MKLSKHTKAQVVRVLRLVLFTLVTGGAADLFIGNAGTRLGLTASAVAVLEACVRQAFRVAPAEAPSISEPNNLP